MSTVIKKGQVWTDGVSHYCIAGIVGNKAYAKNLHTDVVCSFVWLNPDNTAFSIHEPWKLVPGVQDPPTRFIIPSRLVK